MFAALSISFPFIVVCIAGSFVTFIVLFFAMSFVFYLFLTLFSATFLYFTFALPLFSATSFASTVFVAFLRRCWVPNFEEQTHTQRGS